ncbi:hypothetical protein ACFO4N_14880 [Camelliibacillus cellulosilyticus]|uniref:Uncharacterized protein n=1 Tax=Camelliibacillus cellulosilyticus TaxID=2174486 RepID=A0ABV9GSQ8_9BACL
MRFQIAFIGCACPEESLALANNMYSPPAAGVHAMFETSAVLTLLQ